MIKPPTVSASPSVRLPVIGIDYTPAYEQGGGIGRYVRELIEALAHEDQQTIYRLFAMGVNSSTHPLPPVPASNFTWTPSRISPAWYARIWHRARLPISVEWWTGKLDLFHATDFVLPPTHRSTRTVLTVHDLSFVRVPDSANPSLKAYLDQVVPRSVRRADHVLADSEATKVDLIDLYQTPAEKITVLLSGVNPRFKPITDVAPQSAIRAKYKIGSAPYLFAIGTVQPRKNYERLMQALATLPSEFSDVQLVIAGGKGWLQAPIYDALRHLKLEDRVHFIGFADDVDLPTLISGSIGVAFPSLYEGFGLPILEGMACGVPVLTSNGSSMIEAAGDAAILVDPLSVESIRDGLIRLVGDAQLRKGLIERGLDHVKGFTWSRAAQELQTVYQSLL